MTRQDQATAKLHELEAACRSRRLPLTVQRRAVLEALAGRADHPTADQILEEVRARLPEMSRTTVYRVLETLVRLGLAVKICHPGSGVRFDAVTTRHHHLVCTECERVLDLHVPELNGLRLPKPGRGFEISDYTIHFRGLCADCRGGARASRTKGGKRWQS